jgi:hypothetical protein
MLLVSAAVIYTCTTLSLKLKFKYPVIDCATVDNDYGPTNDNMNMTKATNYEQSAIKEWNANALN